MILFVSSSKAYAQEKIAEIQFKETVIDYGIIENGEDGKKIFEFKNTGNAPLVFNRIFSSCGCTIPKKPEKPVLPGESGEIQVNYDTKRTGIFQKAITDHQPPAYAGKRIKIRYVHQGGNNPIRLIIHGTYVDKLSKDYLRYLSSFIRKRIELTGITIFFELRSKFEK
mgnify:CR=1 FL=1